MSDFNEYKPNRFFSINLKKIKKAINILNICIFAFQKSQARFYFFENITFTPFYTVDYDIFLNKPSEISSIKTKKTQDKITISR